ncbi:GNAT family N-acetyltransferase, partial [Robiginitalea sp.]
MSLVTAKEVARAIQLDRYGPLGTAIGWVLMRITRMSSINRVYEMHKDLPGPEFLDAILKYYEIDFEIPEEDFKRLPKEGAYITISNHPLGGIDGILLL